MTHENLAFVHFNGITRCVLLLFGVERGEQRPLAFGLFLGGTKLHLAVQQMMFTPRISESAGMPLETFKLLAEWKPLHGVPSSGLV